ncbi:hypothetical protein ACHAQA_006598 [Verticillium albo-atrum]
MLVDIGGASIGRVVLQPHPSADPNDPLNWSAGRKRLAIGMVYLYTFGIGIATAVQYSVLTQIAEAQDLHVSQLNLGTGLMFLFLGWGCLLWQPVALAYGRRGVYLASIVLCIVPMVWAPFSSGAGQWYAHRILLGLFAAPVESLPEISVPDLFFAHERGTYMSVYAFALFGSNFLAPFFAGFINDGANWHWVMYFGAFVLAACGIVMFFFMEDTIYFRDTAEGDATVSHKENVTAAETEETTGETIEAGTDLGSPYPPRAPYRKRLALTTILPGRPSPLQTLQKSWQSLKIIVFFPNILWAGLLYGTNLAWYNVMNATMSTILGSSPYNLSPTMIGVTYLSPFAAGAITILWSGWVADVASLHLARRNKGIREPEHRLWTLLLSGLVASAGLVLWGAGSSRGVHIAGLLFGLAFVTFGIVCGGAIALAYTIDCFKEMAGESMMSVMIIRNTLGFGFNYSIDPWMESVGRQNCFITVSVIALVCTYSFLVMVFFGKSLRRTSARRYWKYVAQGRGMSSGH